MKSGSNSETINKGAENMWTIRNSSGMYFTGTGWSRDKAKQAVLPTEGNPYSYAKWLAQEAKQDVYLKTPHSVICYPYGE